MKCVSSTVLFCLMSKASEIYDSSPYWLQHLLLNLYAFRIKRQRYGVEFRRVLSDLLSSEKKSADEIRAYQLVRLQTLIRHAYSNVPYYQSLFKEICLKPEDIKCLSDIERIPVLTREIIREQKDSLIDSRIQKSKLFAGHTSGTTGSPLSFYWDIQTCLMNNALDWRQKSWAGIHPGDKIALFLGRTIVSTKRSSPPFWNLDRFQNQLWVSSFHLADSYLEEIVAKLKTWKPKAIEGYPSSLYVLARYLEKTNQTLPLRAAFSSSETLQPMQRELIEDRLCCKLFDFYGMAERVVFASQCPEKFSYHLNPEFAINEIVDSDGKTLAPGEKGYLVGTSLHNFAMPFIRYRTTDVTSISPDPCECGRSMKVLEAVATKDEDIVVTPEGKQVVSSVLTHPFKPLKGIKESQIVQKQLDVLLVKVVVERDFPEEQRALLIRGLRDRVGKTMKIDVEQVERIERTKSGKFRWVISDVELP